MQDEVVQCVECGEDYPLARRKLGFDTCLACGELKAREVQHTIVPMHKSNLVVVSPGDRDMLQGISNKGGQVHGGGASNGKVDKQEEWAKTRKTRDLRTAIAKQKAQAKRASPTGAAKSPQPSKSSRHTWRRIR